MTAKFFIITAAVLACLVLISAGLAIEGFKKAKATQAKLEIIKQAMYEPLKGMIR